MNPKWWLFGFGAFSVGILSLWGDTVTGFTGNSTPFENRQPTLAVRYIIATSGIFPTNGGGTPGNGPPDRTNPFLGEIKAVPYNFAPKGWMFCEGQALPINQNQALFSLLETTYGGNGVTTFNLPDLRGRVPIGRGPNNPIGQQIGIAQPTLSVGNLPAHSHTLPAGGSTASAGSGIAVDDHQPSLAIHFLIAGNGEIMMAAWDREDLQPPGWAFCDGQILPAQNYVYLFNYIGTSYGGDNQGNFALPDLRGRAVVGDDPANNRPVGLSFGIEGHVLSAAEMPAHTHTVTGGNTGSTGGAGVTFTNFQPSLVMKWLISLYGVYPSETGGAGFPGVCEMRIIAGNTAGSLYDSDWKPLDGTAYPDNTAVDSLLGNMYGAEAAVPYLRSRLAIHADSSLPIGHFAGQETLNITTDNLASHAHIIPSEIGVEQPAGNPLVDGMGTVDFGTIGSDGGSSMRTFTITNTGVGDLIIQVIKRDGANATDFTIGAPGTNTIAPNGSTTFTVTFSPAASGNRSATLHVVNNDSDESPFDIPVVGTRYTHLEDWRTQYFGTPVNSGPGADGNDFEGDGLTNIEEFAIGTDPKHSTSTPFNLQRVGNTLQFTYQRSKDAMADGFTFQIQVRADLAVGTWTNSLATEEIVFEDAEIQQVRASQDISGIPRGFVRLHILPPP